MQRWLIWLLLTSLIMIVPAFATASAAVDKSLAAAVAIPNAHVPLPGLLTGGQPTASQLEQAQVAGVQTVISLRTPGESDFDEAATVKKLGMTYINIPVAGAAGVTPDNARRLDAALGKAAGPVLLHCSSGNRVGALMALRAVLIQGRSVEEGLQLGRSAGLTRLEPKVREVLDRESD
ncbi:MAG: protein tyrosine phosphatase family protein [Gammaproteobacteria bacterium]